jgi:hypothetical protein
LRYDVSQNPIWIDAFDALLPFVGKCAAFFDSSRLVGMYASRPPSDLDGEEPVMRKWKKTQLQAYIDKYGLSKGPALLRRLKIHAARARWASGH